MLYITDTDMNNDNNAQTALFNMIANTAKAGVIYNIEKCGPQGHYWEETNEKDVVVDDDVTDDDEEVDEEEEEDFDPNGSVININGVDY